MSQSYDAARFDETFGALKRCINSLVSQAYAEAALGPTQVRVLRYIGKHAPISQAEIARATATDPALTGRALQALIEREWVLRERSAEDRRQYLLKLGAAGQRAWAWKNFLRGNHTLFMDPYLVPWPGRNA